MATDDPEEPELTRDGEFVVLRAPYNHFYLLELKRRIPPEHRTFDPVTRSWRVHVSFEDMVMFAVHRHFPGSRLATAAVPLVGAKERENAYRELWLIEGAPREAVDAVYQALMSMYASESSGSHIQMRLTEAYRWIVDRTRDERDEARADMGSLLG